MMVSDGRIAGGRRLERVLFVLFLLAGVLVRVWAFGDVPRGMNQDEAFAAYEAYSLFRTGLDTAGYHMPVYLTAWGSGMNVLESYLMVPFIALFGLEAWAVRMPQLLIGILSLPAMYGVLKRVSGTGPALCGMFLLAICPWHVFLSRWGLESNLAPGFLLFGLYCFLRGLERPAWLVPSALMYGLSLYCYAAIWPFVPVILALQAGYALRCGKLRLSGWDAAWAACAVGVLLLAALPLFLFLLVNFGVIGEIRAPFLSVPEIACLRTGEFSILDLPKNVVRVLWMTLSQYDGLPWNSTVFFGMFYHVTAVFFLAGLCHAAYELAEAVKSREFRPEGILLFQFLAALVQGALVYANANRANMLWMPFVALSASGAWFLLGRLGRRGLVTAGIIYIVLFALFARYYFTGYAQYSGRFFADGLGQAVEAAMESGGLVHVSPDISYAQVLFYSGQDPDAFRETVRYRNYPGAFLACDSFGRFVFDAGIGMPCPDGVYVLDAGADLEPFLDGGFELDAYGAYLVAHGP